MRLNIGNNHFRSISMLLAFLAAAAFVTAICSLQVFAQDNGQAANATNKSTPTPTPEPTPISLSSVNSEAERVLATIRDIRQGLAEPPAIQNIKEQLPEIRSEIDEGEPATARILSETPTLDELRPVERKWQAIAGNFVRWKRDLQDRIAALDKNVGDLDQLGEIWNKTLVALQNGVAPGKQNNTKSGTAITATPPEILKKLKEVINSIDDTRREVEVRRTQLLTLQTRVSELETRVSNVQAELKAVRQRTLTNLFVRDSPPIWSFREEAISAENLFLQVGKSFSLQAATLIEYATGHGDRFALHGLVFLLVTAGLFWVRKSVRPYVEKEPKLERAVMIFKLPVATGLILTILIGRWFYPNAPRLLMSLLGAAVLVPVVLVLRHLVDKPLFRILNALVVLYFVDRLREILVDQPLTSRFVFIAEMLGAIIFLIWLWRSKKITDQVEARNYRILATIRKVVPTALVIFGLALLANLIGFVGLANVFGNGVLGSVYAALVLYTAVQIIRSLVIFALRISPLTKLRGVRNNRSIIRDKVVRVIYWLAAVIWILVALNLFSIREPIFAFFREAFAWSVNAGSIGISVGDVTIFGVAIWLAVLISRLLRFVLEEDVYPRVNIGDGVSYAVSTMLHYSLLVIGFVIGVAALGVDFTKFAIIAGAVGIGVGFGLQNIVNNFVSGLILLFERPVKVGDTIQLGEHIGALKQIGLRASVLRKVDGSDVIVPNSQLISEEVINWTMSDKQRRIDISVGVAYGSNPEFVIELLKKVAAAKEGVLTDPEPRALFLGFGDNSLDFELRAWTDSSDHWVVLRSEIVTGVYAALNEAGIEIPFPQRDLHIRSVDKSAAKNLHGDKGS